MSLSFTFDNDEFHFVHGRQVVTAARAAHAGAVQHTIATDAPVPVLPHADDDLEWSMERLKQLKAMARRASLRERRRLQLDAFNDVMRKCLEERLGLEQPQS